MLLTSELSISKFAILKRLNNIMCRQIYKNLKTLFTRHAPVDNFVSFMSLQLRVLQRWASICFFGILTSFPLAVCPKVALLDHIVTLFSIVLGSTMFFHNDCTFLLLTSIDFLSFKQ